MAGITRAHGELRADGESVSARNFLETSERLLRLVHRVKRQRRFVTAVTLSCRELRVFLLQVRRIGEQKLAKFVRGRVGIDGAAVSGVHEAR